MRIERLDLLRYGPFADTSLMFAPAGCDFQLVFGSNEAGKSTTLAAIEDLLFGFPHSTPYDFLYPSKALRVGGALAQGGQRFEFQRRKGRTGTLLQPDGAPLAGGESLLVPFLNGATREFMARMFGLNHQRLQDGGHAMLRAEGEAGQALFSAGTGLVDLRQRIQQLALAADGLWAPRRASSRAWYAARDAMQEVAARERASTITAAAYGDAKRRYDDADNAYRALNERRRRQQQEQRRLARIRRVYRSVRDLEQVEVELGTLGVPVAFAADAEEQLANARLDHHRAQSQIETLTQQLDSLRDELAAVQCDDGLLARAETVDALHRQRIQVEKEQRDLPRRYGELNQAKEALLTAAIELGWSDPDPTSVIARIPPRADVTRVNALAAAHGVRESCVENAKGKLEEAKDRRKDLEAALGELPVAMDVADLEAAVDAARSATEAADAIVRAKADEAAANADIDRGLALLKPTVATVEALDAMPVPPLAHVRSWRDVLHEQRQRAAVDQEAVRKATREVERLRSQLARRTAAERIVTAEALAAARSRRDSGWRLIRARYVDGREASADEVAAFCAGEADLPTVFEAAVQSTDALADQRFDKAASAGELAAFTTQLRDGEAELQQLIAACGETGKAGEQLRSEWSAIWEPCGFQPLDPDAMLDWMARRDTILQALATRRDTDRCIRDATERDHTARTFLLGALGCVPDAAETLANKPLRFLIERATRFCEQHRGLATERGRIEREIRVTERDINKTTTELQRADEEWHQWENQWRVALAKLGLPPAVTSDEVLARFNTIDELRGHAHTIADLQHQRIKPMLNDIQRFEDATKACVRSVAADLDGVAAAEAALAVERRLKVARETDVRRHALQHDNSQRTRDIQELSAARDKADGAIQALQQIAGCDTPEQLDNALHRAHRVHELLEKKRNLIATIQHDGDERTLEQLRDECMDINLTQVEADDVKLQEDAKAMQIDLDSAIETRTKAEQDLRAIGSDDGAARLAAEHEEALTDLRTAAERYVRARTAVVMLQWVIDRYQREKQAPLVQRAGTLFRRLTSEAFIRVRAEFDDQDRAHLVGVRPDGSSTAVSGMSDGTADQLFLALRLAAIYEHLEHAPALPVIADDLLINFDDQRAAAALKVLGELAGRTQVLFFTHHQHLVNLATQALGADAHIVQWDHAA